MTGFFYRCYATTVCCVEVRTTVLQRTEQRRCTQARKQKKERRVEKEGKGIEIN